MVNIKSELLQQFQKSFGGARPSHVVRAPGRVNLIGEHTDYNDGFVLPIAMTQALTVLVGPADGREIGVHTTAFDQSVRFPAQDPGSPQEPAWSNYVRGMAAMLTRAGVPLKPANLLIHSDVPIGGGVSSSAALEVGSGLALLGVAGREMDRVELALLGQQAEHQYANSPCGIMDQFICALGREGHALLLDCRTHGFEQIPFGSSDSVLLVMNTQVKHSIGSSQYPVRRRQCEEGLAVLKKSYPDIVALRDLMPDQLEAARDALDPLIYRRCRHVVSEVARTLEASRALRTGNLDAFGRLMYASHASLRDDYEASCIELDALVEIAGKVPGVYGARMTGGGFGGCAIALLRRDSAEALRDAVVRQYDRRFPKPAQVYETSAADGAAIASF